MIGAGLAGLTVAREVALRGWSVVVLEANRVAWAASGRNTGFVLPGFGEHIDDIVERVGLDHAKQLWALSQHGVDYVRRTIEDTGMPGVDPVPGWLNVSKTDNGDELDAYVERLRWIGADVEAWPTARVRAVLANPRYFNAVHFPTAFHIHPLNYALGLAAAAEAAGARIFEQTPAVSIDLAGVRKRIVTPGARVRAGHVVIAGNVDLGALMPRLSATLLPVTTYVLVTEPLGPRLAELVRYRGAAAQMRTRSQQIAASEGTINGSEITTVGGTYERFVRVPAATDATSFAAKLRTQSDVADVFPVHNRIPLGRPATTVNDLHGNNHDQWYLFADGFPNAWSYNLGASAKIAIIDTGVDLTNTDLSAKIDFSKGYQTTTAQDTNGHGTNVSGIAGSLTNNTTGFAGAGYSVRLLAYNIFPDATASSHDQTASVADEVSAINDAVAKGTDVISLSLGAAQDYGTDFNAAGFDQGEHDAIEAAITGGVVVVAAAGNDADGGESGTPHLVLDYPAAYDNVISVGATSLHDTANPGQFTGATEYVAPYSQYGPGLGVVAPGGDPGSNDVNPLHWIWNYSTSTANFATDKCTTPSPPTSCSAFFAGTSQATPQVSAAAALLISVGGHHSLTPARVAQLIDDTADNIGDPHQGHGRLNVYKAIALLFSDTGAYSGPVAQKTSPTQTVAFAYSNSGSNKPVILDANYPGGVPVDASGNFRIGDVPAATGNYRVGVWYDANGDGTINAGDQFGGAAVTCNSASKCTIGTITMTTVAAGFTLP